MTASVTIYNCIPYGDAREHNGASGVQIFGRSTPNPRGLSPFSSASLYLKTQSSTPCERLANSLDSTLDSRYEISSGGNATVSDFLRIVRDMQEKSLELIINICIRIAYTSCIMHDGVLQNDKIDCASASHAGPGRHWVRGHGVSREPRGSGPRRRVGEPPALPLAGADEGPEGGNRPLPAADLPHALWHCGGEAIA